MNNAGQQPPNLVELSDYRKPLAAAPEQLPEPHDPQLIAALEGLQLAVEAQHAAAYRLDQPADGQGQLIYFAGGGYVVNGKKPLRRYVAARDDQLRLLLAIPDSDIHIGAVLGERRPRGDRFMKVVIDYADNEIPFDPGALDGQDQESLETSGELAAGLSLKAASLWTPHRNPDLALIVEHDVLVASDSDADERRLKLKLVGSSAVDSFTELVSLSEPVLQRPGDYFPSLYS